DGSMKLFSPGVSPTSSPRSEIGSSASPSGSPPSPAVPSHPTEVSVHAAAVSASAPISPPPASTVPSHRHLLRITRRRVGSHEGGHVKEEAHGNMTGGPNRNDLGSLPRPVASRGTTSSWCAHDLWLDGGG